MWSGDDEGELSEELDYQYTSATPIRPAQERQKHASRKRAAASFEVFSTTSSRSKKAPPNSSSFYSKKSKKNPSSRKDSKTLKYALVNRVDSNNDQANNSSFSDDNGAVLSDTDTEADLSDFQKAPMNCSNNAPSSTPPNHGGSTPAGCTTTNRNLVSRTSSTPVSHNGATLNSTPANRNGSSLSSTPASRNGATLNSTPANRIGFSLSSTPAGRNGSTLSSTPANRNGSSLSSTPASRSGSTLSSTPVNRNGSILAGRINSTPVVNHSSSSAKTNRTSRTSFTPDHNGVTSGGSTSSLNACRISASHMTDAHNSSTFEELGNCDDFAANTSENLSHGAWSDSDTDKTANEPSPPVSPIASTNHHNSASTGPSTEVIKLFAQSIKGMNSYISRVSTRLDKMESGIQSIEQRFTSRQPAPKRQVPLDVRSETRKAYHLLLDQEDTDFSGFATDPGTTFKSSHNQDVVAQLVKAVKTFNSNFSTADIRAASYTYYKTLNSEESLKRRGMAEQRKIQRRRRERLARKLKERESALQKLSYNERDKEKLQKVLVMEMMSSEESEVSGDEDDGGGGVLIVRPLPWRNDRVIRFFSKLDQKAATEKSQQARRQTKKRIQGNDSTRPKPSKEFPSWAVN